MRKVSLILLVISLNACHKNNNTHSGETFPNQVGDHWVYKYSPITKPETDTATINVDIIGQITLPDGESANIWTTKYSNGPYVDTSLVVSAASAVKIYYNNICKICAVQMPDERRRYDLPLTVGNKWFTTIWHDTTRVLAELNLQVPAGVFNNTFELSKTLGPVTNAWDLDTIYLTPNIGMTRFIQQEFSLGPFPGNGIWELADYKLK
jgi:hypothetical protein